MSIGTQQPPEWSTHQDRATGRTIRQLTGCPANNYPLYYFIPSITHENDALVFHSERSGWVQLYKLDLNDGTITQLTDGHTRDSGWAIWCEPHLRGIYNHLSALNQAKREVYYFQDEEVRCTHLDTLANRLVCTIPGRISIGQTGFSPDGKHFAFIHADRAHFTQAFQDREAILNMGQPFSHEEWRRQVPVTISVIDTDSGAMRTVIDVPYHVHHVFFLDNEWLLVNHVAGENGMWTVKLDGSGKRDLRPSHMGNGAICHQVVNEAGIFYEANIWHEGADGKREREVWFGHYNRDDDSFEEVHMPGVGYVHTGLDPAGKFLFVENQMGSEGHTLLSIHYPHQPDKYELRTLRTLQPIIRGQRYHAHPFLGPDRKWLYYTEVIDGFSQVCALDVADLVDLDEYWDARG